MMRYPIPHLRSAGYRLWSHNLNLQKGFNYV